MNLKHKTSLFLVAGLVLTGLIYLYLNPQTTENYPMEQTLKLKMHEPQSIRSGVTFTYSDYSIEQTEPMPGTDELPVSGYNFSVNVSDPSGKENLILYYSPGPQKLAPVLSWKKYEIGILEVSSATAEAITIVVREK